MAYSLIVCIITLLPVYASDLNSYENQSVNDEFTVSLPLNWDTFAINSYIGPATALMDNENTADVIVVHITSNTNCSKRIEENLNFNLEIFNTRAGVANITVPEYGIDNVTEYGKFNDGKIGIIYLGLRGGNVVTVYGTYDTLEEAKEASEQFDVISRSVMPLKPAPVDICSKETVSPTPAPYKPRVVPTVAKTIKPTPAPTIIFKSIDTPTPIPTQFLSATPIPTQVYAAAIIPSTVYSATPIPTQVYTATPIPTRTYSPTPIPTQYVPPITSYTGTCPCNCNGPDLNCKDFSSHAQAQACYECCKKTHGDIFGLDRDGDGIVCESLR
ncbi:MAG: hypothetical protein GX640_13620 [Fibrobacter sp.]|nr:hypothetical protein [Fibrobacter sp.]